MGVLGAWVRGAAHILRVGSLETWRALGSPAPGLPGDFPSRPQFTHLWELAPRGPGRQDECRRDVWGQTQASVVTVGGRLGPVSAAGLSLSFPAYETDAQQLPGHHWGPLCRPGVPAGRAAGKELAPGCRALWAPVGPEPWEEECGGHPVPRLPPTSRSPPERRAALSKSRASCGQEAGLPQPDSAVGAQSWAWRPSECPLPWADPACARSQDPG